MMPVVERAEMHMSQACTEAIKQLVRRVHRRVDCANVRHVETEACVRQVLKELLHLIGDASRELPVVHVLEDEPGTESAVPADVRERVRVGHDRPHPKR
jgi:hypothetical protein